MSSRFRHVALIGKYQDQAPGARHAGGGARSDAMQEIAAFLRAEGCNVVCDASVDEIGRHCDLGLVVGGDGTMLGIGRQLAPYGVPLIGINTGGWASSPTFRSTTTRAPWPPCWPASTRKTPQPDACAGDPRRRVGVRCAGDERCGRQPRRHLRDGRTARLGRASFRRQPARRRLHHRLADRLDRLCAVGRGPLLHPRFRAGCWCRSRRTHCRTAGGTARRRRDLDRTGRPAATPAPISTCSRLPRCSTAIASWCGVPISGCASCTRTAGVISTRCARSSTGTREVPSLALRRIALRDFVIVRELELDLDAGFTVLTGGNRCRQVDPDRRAAAGAGQPRPTLARCAKAPTGST